MGSTLMGRLGFFAFWAATQILAAVHLVYGIIRGEHCVWTLTNLCTSLLFPKFYLSPTSEKPSTSPTMYLSNHRSWTDFTLDNALLGGPSYLSRVMVIVAVPFSVYTTWLSGAIFLFKRKPGISRDWFTEFIGGNMKARPGSSVIVYPEGTRNLKAEPLKLKTGVLTVAWNLKLQVQAVVTTNKEYSLNEKKLMYRSGAVMVVHLSKVIKPADYKDQAEWEAACTAVFAEAWAGAYAAKDPTPIRELPLAPLPKPRREPLVPGRLFWARLLLVVVTSPLWMRYVSAAVRGGEL